MNTLSPLRFSYSIPSALGFNDYDSTKLDCVSAPTSANRLCDWKMECRAVHCIHIQYSCREMETLMHTWSRGFNSTNWTKTNANQIPIESDRLSMFVNLSGPVCTSLSSIFLLQIAHILHSIDIKEFMEASDWNKRKTGITSISSLNLFH